MGLLGMVLGLIAAKQWVGGGSILWATVGAGIGGGLSAIVDHFIDKSKKKHDVPGESQSLTAEEEIATAIENDTSPDILISKKEKPFYYGFGGWLYIVTIGQLFTLYTAITTIFEADIPLLNSPEWKMLSDPQSSDYNPLWEPFIYAEIGASALIILLIALIGFLTVKLSRHYKAAQIALYTFNFVYSMMVVVFMISLNSHYNPPVFSENDFTKIITQASVASLIWIPYFLLSKRVKNTFNR